MASIHLTNIDKVLFHKPDLDTCLTALFLGVTEGDKVDRCVQPQASPAELDDPTILCIEVGGSGEIEKNNFDHHSPLLDLAPACRQAAEVQGIEDPSLLRLVDYVCLVDVGSKSLPAIGYPSLSTIFSGMRFLLWEPIAEFQSGIQLLQKFIKLKIDPFAPVPGMTEWLVYLEAKSENSRQVEQLLDEARCYWTPRGRKVGVIRNSQQTSKSFGGCFALYQQGYDIVIMFNPWFGYEQRPKYTIASRDLDVRQRLIPQLNALESGWGGHQTIIGSPLGSRLTEDQVLSLVLESF